MVIRPEGIPDNQRIRSDEIQRRPAIGEPYGGSSPGTLQVEVRLGTIGHPEGVLLMRVPEEGSDPVGRYIVALEFKLGSRSKLGCGQLFKGPISISHPDPAPDREAVAQLIRQDSPRGGILEVCLGRHRSKRRRRAPVCSQAEGRIQTNPDRQAVVEWGRHIKLRDRDELRIVLVSPPIEIGLRLYSELHGIDPGMDRQRVQLGQPRGVIVNGRGPVGSCHEGISP